MSKGDVVFPYSGFSEDSLAYRKSRDFWDRAFSERLGSSRVDHWSNWIEDIFHDGNPIFSKMNASLGRGVLVQQVAAGPDRYWFKCWVSHTENADRIVPYLFVETFISLEAEVYFKKLIEAWCIDEFGEEDMTNLTGQTLLAAGERFDHIDFNSEV